MNRVDVSHLVTKVLSDIGLMEDDDARRVELPCINRRSSRDAESQWGAVHGKHDDAGVLGCVVGDAAEVCLDDVVAIQEWELSIWLDPDLMGARARQLSQPREQYRKKKKRRGVKVDEPCTLHTVPTHRGR